MKITELIEQLKTAQGIYGDIPVCLAQLQPHGSTARLTGVKQVYVQYGIVYVTNMNDDEITATVDA